MEGKKISISLSEVYSSGVDDKIKTQSAVARTAEHSQQRQGGSPPPLTPAGMTTTGGTATAIRSIAVIGLAFGVVGALIGEVPWLLRNAMTDDLVINGKTPTADEIGTIQATFFVLNAIWYGMIGGALSAGLASSYSLASKNWKKAATTGIVGLVIGTVATMLLGSCAVEPLYRALGGGGDQITAQLVFARTIGWAVIGAVTAIAPGIVMRSGRRFWLGLAGGFAGGFVGGLVFDLIGSVVGNIGAGTVSRVIGVAAIGLGTGLATGLLEQAAKQGWLFVRAGLIVGKQFILYRNPTTIGSSPQCEIYLFKDTQIAPRHAALHVLPGRFEIEALDQAFPLYVNGQAVARQPLKGGDQVQIGSTVFEFQFKSQHTAVR